MPETIATILPQRQLRLMPMLKAAAAKDNVTVEVAVDKMAEDFRDTPIKDKTLAAAVHLAGTVRVAPQDEKLLVDTFKRHGIHSLSGAVAVVAGAILKDALESPKAMNMLRTEPVSNTQEQGVVPPTDFNLRDAVDALEMKSGKSLDDMLEGAKQELDKPRQGDDSAEEAGIKSLGSILRISADDQQYIADAAHKHGITDNDHVSTLIAGIAGATFAAQFAEINGQIR